MNAEPGKKRPIAKILAPSKTIVAGSIGVTEPRNTDALPELEFSHARAQRIHAPDDFVAGNNGQFAPPQIAVDHVQIRAAHAACTDFDANLIRTRQRIVAFVQRQWCAQFIEDHGVHRWHDFTSGRPRQFRVFSLAAR